MRKIPYYFVKFIVSPHVASEEIAKDIKNLWSGFWFIFVFCLAYSIVALIFYLLKHLPVAKTFLTIPMEKWYLIQTFTTIPVGYAGLMSYSGLAYLLRNHILSITASANWEHFTSLAFSIRRAKS